MNRLINRPPTQVIDSEGYMIDDIAPYEYPPPLRPYVPPRPHYPIAYPPSYPAPALPPTYHPMAQPESESTTKAKLGAGIFLWFFIWLMLSPLSGVLSLVAWVLGIGYLIFRVLK